MRATSRFKGAFGARSVKSHAGKGSFGARRVESGCKSTLGIWPDGTFPYRAHDQTQARPNTLFMVPSFLSALH